MRWSFKDSKRKSFRIAVSGIGKHVGVTHFSILLGAYFRYKEGKKVCIVDLSGGGSYLELEHLYLGHNLSESDGYFYSIHKLDFLVSGDFGERIRKALQDDYEVVIFDCGTKIATLEQELIMCDRKYVLGCCSPWNQKQWEAYFELQQLEWEEQRRFGYRYGYSFGAEENAQVIAEEYKVGFVHIPFIENPFRIRREQMQGLREIIWEEKYL